MLTDMKGGSFTSVVEARREMRNCNRWRRQWRSHDAERTWRDLDNQKTRDEDVHGCRFQHQGIISTDTSSGAPSWHRSAAWERSVAIEVSTLQLLHMTDCRPRPTTPWQSVWTRFIQRTGSVSRRIRSRAHSLCYQNVRRRIDSGAHSQCVRRQKIRCLGKVLHMDKVHQSAKV